MPKYYKKPMKGSLETAFVIDHIKEPSKKVSCKYCNFYDGDSFCLQNKVDLKLAGYNMYKYCSSFTGKRTCRKCKHMERDGYCNVIQVNLIKKGYDMDEVCIEFELKPKSRTKSTLEQTGKELVNKTTKHNHRKKNKIKNKSTLKEITLGSRVELYDYTYKENVTYQIVSMGEADILENKISDKSPLGMALLGGQRGKKIEVDTPSGKESYKVLSFSK